MKHIYHLSAVVVLMFLAGGANAQKVDPAAYDTDKASGLLTVPLPLEAEEQAKANVLIEKQNAAQLNAGYALIPGFVYQPEAIKEVNDYNYHIAREAYKLADPGGYETLTGATN